MSNRPLDYNSLPMFGKGRWASCGRVLVLLAAVCPIRPAAADEASVSVRVDCPALGEERRSALESRANTELLVRRESGTLSVSCDPEGVRLHWQPAAGSASEHRIPLAADAIATEEQILEALEALLRPPPPASTEPAVPAQPPAPAKKPPETRRIEPVAASKNAPAAPAPAVQLRGPRAEAVPPYFDVLAGVAAELWSSEVVGAVGPGGRVIWTLPGDFALSAGAAIVWTLQSPENVSGRVVRLQLGGEYHLDRGRRWRLGAAALLDLLHASRASGTVAESEDEQVFGGVLSARYALLNPPWAIMLGPTFSLRPAKVLVEIGQREIFRIPVVAPGLTAELGFGPL